MIDRIQWLGHGSFRIEGPPHIYVNPWRVARDSEPADVVLISNDQYDHCSLPDIEKLLTPDTVLLTNPAASEILGDRAMVLRPWQSFNVGAARITAVPAYTFSDQNPVSNGAIGFVISIDYYDIYYAGSTDIVPELDHIEADVAIIPLVTGHGSLDLERSVALIDSVRAQWVLPSHWGTMSGTHLDVQALERALDARANVVLPEIWR